MNKREWAAMKRRVRMAGMSAVNSAAKEVESQAKKYAPIRKIFTGGSRMTRMKTLGEYMKDRKTRARLGLAPDVDFLHGDDPGNPRARFRMVNRTTVPTGPGMSGYGDNMNMDKPTWRKRVSPGGPLPPRAMKRLNPQGKYEVKSGRADYKGRVGGRLRGEIHTVPATTSDGLVIARVVAPTPYAKYQEFGTRRHAAQPFLRPALREKRQELVSQMRNEIRDAIRGGKIEETVEL